MPRRLRRAQQIYRVDQNTDNNNAGEDVVFSSGAAAAGLLDNALDSNNLEYNNGHRKLTKSDKSTKEAKADKVSKADGGDKSGKSEKAMKSSKMEFTKDMKSDKSSGAAPAPAKKQVRQAPDMESVAMDGMSSMSMDMASMSMEMHEQVELMMGSMSM